MTDAINLPDILITYDKIEQFKADMKAIHALANIFGAHISRLAAELVNIYDIKDETVLTDPGKIAIRNVCTNCLNVLHETMKECEYHIDYYTMFDTEMTLKGDKYKYTYTMFMILSSSYFS